MFSSTRDGRVISLVVEFCEAMVIGIISDTTWNWNAYYDIPNTPISWIIQLTRWLSKTQFWLAILLWFSILGLVCRKNRGKS